MDNHATNQQHETISSALDPLVPHLFISFHDWLLQVKAGLAARGRSGPLDPDTYSLATKLYLLSWSVERAVVRLEMVGSSGSDGAH